MSAECGNSYLALQVTGLQCVSPHKGPGNTIKPEYTNNSLEIKQKSLSMTHTDNTVLFILVFTLIIYSMLTTT